MTVTALREAAISGLKSVFGGPVHTLRSPLIKNKRRALRLAETLFLNLNHYRVQRDRSKMPRAGEIILSFDDDIALFRQRLQRLSVR